MWCGSVRPGSTLTPKNNAQLPRGHWKRVCNHTLTYAKVVPSILGVHFSHRPYLSTWLRYRLPTFWRFCLHFHVVGPSCAIFFESHTTPCCGLSNTACTPYQPLPVQYSSLEIGNRFLLASLHGPFCLSTAAHLGTRPFWAARQKSEMTSHPSQLDACAIW